MIAEATIVIIGGAAGGVIVGAVAIWLLARRRGVGRSP